MNERQEDPANSKRIKKMEKPQVPNYREYLDMDTEEEEFGRQETPEPEEELEVEPDKPVFTEEELNTLVQHVKDFTTISGLDNSQWSTGVIEIVKEYFCNPANMILTIYRESKILRARLDFPERTDEGLTYFLRSAWQIYTPENFLTTIIFGSVSGEIEKSTLKFVDNMYAPIAFRSDEWPVVMRNEIFSNLHKFLMCLTDASYNPMGLTILYVPREGLEDSKKNVEYNEEVLKPRENIQGIISANEDDKTEDLVERLERVARYWIRQIRDALNGPCSSSKSSPCKTIVDEIRYWHYSGKYSKSSSELTFGWERIDENLSCVYDQLTNKSVLSIVKKLESIRSASIKQYNPLVTQVREILDEATSNITYLNLLEKFNEGFEIPDGVEEYSIEILLLIRFIGIESPFYRGEEKIEILCRAFCTQAVEHLQRYIDLDIIFNGDAEDGKKMILKCLKCCEKIGDIYERLVDMDQSTNSRVISLTDKRKIFNHVNTFVQRCNDLIGIAEVRMAFDKCDEPITIHGPKGSELGAHYRKIEKLFHVTLSEIKNSRDDILDIVSANWLDRIVNFKREIKNVENMVKNWINDIFEDIVNVEEAIEALHGIKRFSKRSDLRETLNEKWIQIWKIFGAELENCSMTIINDSGLLHHPSLPPYSGNANIIRINKIYLTRQYKMLIDASDWFGDCDAQVVVTRKYKRVLAAMTKKEQILFSDWQKYLTDNKINPEMITNQPILKYHSTKNGTIGVNLEIYYLDNIREITEWTILGYDTKNIFSKNCPKWQVIKLRYNKVESICTLYNSIVETSSRSDRFLFAASLDDLEEIMSSGFKKITWSSESFERFFADSIEEMMKIEEVFEVYRIINWRIDYMTRGISTTSLVNCEKNLIEILENSKTYLEHGRRQGVTIVGEKWKTIFKLLLELKVRVINIDKAQTAQSWDDYVTDIYKKLMESVTDCIRLSLRSVLKFLCHYLMELPGVVIIDVDRAQIGEIAKEIKIINVAALKDAIPVEEFSEIFEMKDGLDLFMACIERDDEILDLRRQIDQFFCPINTQ